MPEVRIVAEPRTEFGKGAARRVRRAGRVPAIVYGHGTETRHITLPGLQHVIIVTVLLTFIFTLNDFNIVYVMTRGGPGTATQVFATYSYEVAFNQLRWGRGVTIAIYAVPLLVALMPLVSRYLLRERAA